MLVDTSIWVDHLRHRNVGLVEQLELGEVWVHPFIIGELACGNLANRADILALLAALPQAPLVDHREVLGFVEQRRLMGRGLGWVDMHLLASAAIGSLGLWTRDDRLDAAARALGLQS